MKISSLKFIKMKTKYKIICICSIYNEIEKGNLERFFKYTKPLVDDIVIYDDGSTDGSYEYSLKQTPHVIRSGTNDFVDEVNHRKILLEKALTLNPDFILRLDADEILNAGTEEKLQKICQDCERGDLDAIEFHRLNIWRSATWSRTDSLYNDGWEAFLWKVTPAPGFEDNPKRGLHQTALQ